MEQDFRREVQDGLRELFAVKKLAQTLAPKLALDLIV